MKLNEVFTQMVERTGVSRTEASIKTILDNPAFASIDVPEEVSKKLTQEMLTLEAAKSNPEITKHFNHSILGGVDREIDELSAELPDDAKALLKGEKSSYKKIGVLAAQIKSLESKKAANPANVEALNKEIEKLNGQVKTVREEYENKIKGVNESFEGERLGWKKKSLLGQLVPKMDPKNDYDINMTILEMKVQKEMEKDAVKFVNKDGNLTLRTAADTEYFDKNNNKITPEDYIAKVAANAKLLIASDTKTPGRTTSTQTKTEPIVPGTGLNLEKWNAKVNAQS